MEHEQAKPKLGELGSLSGQAMPGTRWVAGPFRAARVRKDPLCIFQPEMTLLTRTNRSYSLGSVQAPVRHQPERVQGPILLSLILVDKRLLGTVAWKHLRATNLAGWNRVERAREAPLLPYVV